jgi:hypothetical protein
VTSRITAEAAVTAPARTSIRVIAVLVAAALAVDAFVHLADAGFYASVSSAWVSQATLFRVQAVAAIGCAVLLLVRPRWWVLVAAMLLLGGAFVAVVGYTYVDPGAIGPLPDMYDPTWDVPGKVASAAAEGTGAALSGAGLLIGLVRRP